MKDLLISVASINVTASTKTISPPGRLNVFRNGAIVWLITNIDQNAKLTVLIDNFTAIRQGKPANPVKISGELVDLPPGKTGIIAGVVHGVGQGSKEEIRYKYQVIINGYPRDPEIVVCDDPDTNVPPLKRKPRARKPRTKAAKK